MWSVAGNSKIKSAACNTLKYWGAPTHGLQCGLHLHDGAQIHTLLLQYMTLENLLLLLLSLVTLTLPDLLTHEQMTTAS